MEQFKIGKLYQSPDYYLLVWPDLASALKVVDLITHNHINHYYAPTAIRSWTKIISSSNDDDFTTTLANGLKAGLQAEVEVLEAVDSWSQTLELKPICVAKSYDIFMIVDHQQIDYKEYYKVILGTKIGWLIRDSYIQFKEVT